MNYQLHYNNLIDKARNRILSDYKETHHIVPICMGGTDDDSNLIDLTPEEHFVAHQLLVKIYPNNRKLISALSKMCCNSFKNKRTNKWYGWIRKLCSENMSGENNPSSKFTYEQVLEIYFSDEDLDTLSKKYECSRYNITTIKRKIYYRNITKDIEELPGFCLTENKKIRLPIPIDLIPKIFYDTGNYEHFWNTYGATERVVQSIKNKKSFKKITSKLGTPGQVKRYGLTRDMVEEVYNAKGTSSEIAAKYGIHYNTVRNIKGKNSRAFNIWEEF
jgi:hypothetical protein